MSLLPCNSHRRKAPQPKGPHLEFGIGFYRIPLLGPFSLHSLKRCHWPLTLRYPWFSDKYMDKCMRYHLWGGWWPKQFAIFTDDLENLILHIPIATFEKPEEAQAFVRILQRQCKCAPIVNCQQTILAVLEKLEGHPSLIQPGTAQCMRNVAMPD